MRILLTNDDGIHAPGLKVLEAIARQISDDIIIIAPESDQSGVSHSLSLNDPLRLREISDRHFALKGTPTDCVIMGVKHLCKDHPPDLVLSGVNRGQNVAEDVTYSGTIAAAMEGTILKIPSIALSQAFSVRELGVVHWECSQHYGAKVVRYLLKAGIPPGIVMNVNFPPCEPSEMAGLALSVQGQRNQDLLDVEKRLDGRHNPYYWLTLARGNVTPAAGTDLDALRQNRISITPLRLDLTDLPNLTRLAEILDGVT